MGARANRLYFRLQRTAHDLQKRADRDLQDRCALTTAQAAVLELVRKAPGASQRDLARQLGINESAMTGMAGRLENAGLISRERSDSDGRTFVLNLTARGEEMVARAREALAPINALIDEALGQEKAKELSDALDAIASALRC